MVVAVVVAPLVFIVVMHLLESFSGGQTLDQAEDTAQRVSAYLASTGQGGLERAVSLRAAAEPALTRHRQRVRVVAPNGVVWLVGDELASGRGLARVGDLFYGWQRLQVLQSFDARLPALPDRPEVRQALADGAASRCWGEPDANVYVCEAARAVQVPGAGRYVVDVQGSSRRALEALYESRRQVFKLSLFALALGGLLMVWMTRRIVRPVERLREQVRARAAAALPHPGLEVGARNRRLPVGPSAEIADLTDAFNDLLSALSERSRTTERFLADLAHEFKNPVASLRASAEQLRDGAPTPERVKKLAELIHHSSVNLDALVTQFLELAKAEGGLPNEPRESVDLSALLEGLTNALKADARYAGVQVRLESPADPLTVQGVGGRLESAFRNLLDNGASFAGAGGNVTARLERLDGVAQVSISDTGPGVPVENLPRLFERFFTTRGDRHGTGLGLALTRAVVEAHGGTIRAESPEGKGACFVVQLPFTSFSSTNH